VRIRKKFASKNQIGRTVIALRKQRALKQHELLAQLQIKGIDITTQSLSRLEGQERPATDSEVRALSEIFNVPMEELFND